MGEDIELIVAADQTRKAFINFQMWYQQEKGHPKPTIREGLEHTSTLREDLYRRRLWRARQYQ